MRQGEAPEEAAVVAVAATPLPDRAGPERQIKGFPGAGALPPVAVALRAVVVGRVPLARQQHQQFPVLVGPECQAALRGQALAVPVVGAVVWTSVTTPGTGEAHRTGAARHPIRAGPEPPDQSTRAAVVAVVA